MNNTWLQQTIGPILALIVVLGTFGLFCLALFLKVDSANEKVLFMVVGALSSIATTVVSYFFGSSASSSRKNEILQGLSERCWSFENPPQPGKTLPQCHAQPPLEAGGKGASELGELNSS